MQSAFTTVKVSRDLWRLLDEVGKRSGLKKGVLIEKAVIYFVKSGDLTALGISSEDIDLILGTLELSGELALEEAV